MRLNFGLLTAGLALVLGGCAAPQGYVAIKEGSLGAATGKVGVAMQQVPKPDTYFPGASCLLCMATASLANRTLTQHAQSLPSDDLAALKQDVAGALKTQGVQTVVIAEPVDVNSLPDAKGSGTNAAKKDFSALGTKHQIDKLLVIEVAAIGYTRGYATYIPTGDPKAMSNGIGYIVDLKTNTYDWYMPFSVIKGAEGNWDEPPGFPGLTNAYFQVIEGTRDQLVQAFAKAP